MITKEEINRLSESVKSLDSIKSNGVYGGVAAGAGLAGLLSYLYYRKKRSQSKVSRFMKALAWTAIGGLAGGAAGLAGASIYAANKRYKILREMAMSKPSGEKGRVIYANFPLNKWQGKHKVGHAASVMYDPKTGDMTIYSTSSMPKDAVHPDASNMVEYGILNNNPVLSRAGAKYMLRAGHISAPGVAVSKLKIKPSASDSEIADAVASVGRKWGWGRSVELYEGAKDVDLGIAKRMGNLSLLAAHIGGGYSPLPYGYNCGTAAREIFDSVQPNASTVKRLVQVGSPSLNTPGNTNYWATFLSDQDYKSKAPLPQGDSVDFLMRPYQENYQ